MQKTMSDFQQNGVDSSRANGDGDGYGGGDGSSSASDNNELRQNVAQHLIALQGHYSSHQHQQQTQPQRQNEPQINQVMTPYSDSLSMSHMSNMANISNMANMSKRPFGQVDSASEFELMPRKHPRVSQYDPIQQNLRNCGNRNPAMEAMEAVEAVVHLSITKMEPSYTEPWRRISSCSSSSPSSSLVGVGIIIPWEDLVQTIDGKHSFDEGLGVGSATKTEGGVTHHDGPEYDPAQCSSSSAMASSTTYNGTVSNNENHCTHTHLNTEDHAGFHSTLSESHHDHPHNHMHNHTHEPPHNHTQQQHEDGTMYNSVNIDNSAVNNSDRGRATPASLRILTNAYTVQHATTIYARIPASFSQASSSSTSCASSALSAPSQLAVPQVPSFSSPSTDTTSVKCCVEWMSLAMDLALLRVVHDAVECRSRGDEKTRVKIVEGTAEGTSEVTVEGAESQIHKENAKIQEIISGTETNTDIADGTSSMTGIASALVEHPSNGSGTPTINECISTRLPNLGEEITFIGVTTSVKPSMVTPSSMLNFGLHPPRNGSRNFDSHRMIGGNCHSGKICHRNVISGFGADEEHNFLLRMFVDVPSSVGIGATNGGDGRGRGVIVDTSGQIIGISSSSMQNFIPGAVIQQFLHQCRDQSIHSKPFHSKDCASLLSRKNSTTTPSNTDCECDCSASQDTTAAETGTQSEKESGPVSPPPRTPHFDTQHCNPAGQPRIRHIPGIASLGIYGYQTLENTALRKSLGLDPLSVDPSTGIRVIGINHTIHGTTTDMDYDPSQCKRDVGKCHTSMLRIDDVLLAVDGEPIRLDGTVGLMLGREKERVDFRWLVSKRMLGWKRKEVSVKLDVVRQKRRMEITASLSALRYLVPRLDGDGEESSLPSYVVCGGCVFVPLTQAWLSESIRNRERELCVAGCCGMDSSSYKQQAILEFQGFNRYLQEQRKGGQQIIVLSHVLADDVNIGYHGMRNLVLSSVNNQRPVNLQHFVELLVKRENEPFEFRCSYVSLDRAKAAICMDAEEVLNSEQRILETFQINSWCSFNALSHTLRREAEGKATRHGVVLDCWKTMRALRNSVRETTLVLRRANSKDGLPAATRRIMDWSEEHKMQSAPEFSGKYTPDGGWTQVKTKHLSQLCACGKSTRFYCICSVGVMRCKDCFIKHCRDHVHEKWDGCGKDAEGLTEGVDVVPTRKKKKNNPSQAMQSRCAVCRAKTSYCCSACGFEKETALCHLTTGRHCLPMHVSEHHSHGSGCAK